jgi:hypothetical protein
MPLDSNSRVYCPHTGNTDEKFRRNCMRPFTSPRARPVGVTRLLRLLTIGYIQSQFATVFPPSACNDPFRA